MVYVIFTTLALFYSLIFYGAIHTKRKEKSTEILTSLPGRK